ncbi:MAG: hypothetical protein ACOYK6_08845 [Chthoniobacterales bacterium]
MSSTITKRDYNNSLLSEIQELKNKSADKELKLTSNSAIEFFGAPFGVQKTGVTTRMQGRNSCWGSITATFGFDTTEEVKNLVVAALKEELKKSIENNDELEKEDKVSLIQDVDKIQFDNNGNNQAKLTPEVVMTFVDEKLNELRGKIDNLIELQKKRQPQKQSTSSFYDKVTTRFGSTKIKDEKQADETRSRIEALKNRDANSTSNQNDINLINGKQRGLFYGGRLEEQEKEKAIQSKIQQLTLRLDAWDQSKKQHSQQKSQIDLLQEPGSQSNSKSNESVASTTKRTQNAPSNTNQKGFPDRDPVGGIKTKQTTAVLQEVKEAIHKRGEKMNQVAESVTELVEAAGDFVGLAKQLNDQQKKK